jgi:hypothetical protein
VRHGFSCANAAMHMVRANKSLVRRELARYTHFTNPLVVDANLTRFGIAACLQARGELGKVMNERSPGFKGFDHVFSSPIARCIATAHLMLTPSRSDGKIVVAPYLRERYRLLAENKLGAQVAATATTKGPHPTAYDQDRQRLDKVDVRMRETVERLPVAATAREDSVWFFMAWLATQPSFSAPQRPPGTPIKVAVSTHSLRLKQDLRLKETPLNNCCILLVMRAFNSSALAGYWRNDRAAASLAALRKAGVLEFVAPDPARPGVMHQVLYPGVPPPPPSLLRDLKCEETCETYDPSKCRETDVPRINTARRSAAPARGTSWTTGQGPERLHRLPTLNAIRKAETSTRTKGAQMMTSTMSRTQKRAPATNGAPASMPMTKGAQSTSAFNGPQASRASRASTPATTATTATAATAATASGLKPPTVHNPV